MPPKRKAAAQPAEAKPSKRRTRSSALEDIPPLPATTSQATKTITVNPTVTPAAIRTYKGRSKRLNPPPSDVSSQFLKENQTSEGVVARTEDTDDEGEDGSQAGDDLNLLPSKSGEAIVPEFTESPAHSHVENSQQSRSRVGTRTHYIPNETPSQRQQKRGSNKQDESPDLSCIVISSSKGKFGALGDVLVKSAAPNTTPVEASNARNIHTDPFLLSNNDELGARLTRSFSKKQNTSVHRPTKTVVSKSKQVESESPMRVPERSAPNTQTIGVHPGSRAHEKLPADSDDEVEDKESLPSVMKSTVIGLAPHTSPSKLPVVGQRSSSWMSTALPPYLHSCLVAQKHALLRALQNPLDTTITEEDPRGEHHLSTNDIAAQQLGDLLNGTVARGEGNSCLVLGPRGSGKSKVIEKCLSNLTQKPIILRLSGWVQHSDRLAMHEIANQLSRQTGTTYLSNSDEVREAGQAEDDEEDANPFLDIRKEVVATATPDALRPPSSHLPALISLLPTLSRPTVVILDAFHLFASHPRQSLLYCLLDTAQSCRASADTSGITVIGVTSHVDTIQLLEKRVKSRFSGRTIRTGAPRKLKDWKGIALSVLSSHCHCDNSELNSEWKTLWNAGIERFMADKHVQNMFIETFSITNDVYTLRRLLTSLVLQLTPSSPYPLASQLLFGSTIQRSRPRFPFLSKLSYPSLCLLIASVHADTTGHPIFTFEMLHECFRDQVRSSTSAPVQINGGSIGMVRCSREVLMRAFESLISAKIFISEISPSSTTAEEFMKYRCVVGRDDVKKAVEKTGQINLKKWLNKAQ